MFIDTTLLSAIIASVYFYLYLIHKYSPWTLTIQKRAGLSIPRARLPIWIPLEGYLASVVVNSETKLARLMFVLPSPRSDTSDINLVAVSSTITVPLLALQINIMLSTSLR